MSNKVRVYELAKDTGLPNKEVLRRLEELGVDASSHSSSVNAVDAKRFMETLGKSASERAAEDEARQRAEREQLERYKKIDVQAPPENKKAKKVLPPHLRKQQEDADRAKAAAAAATAGPSTPPAAEATPTAEPEAPRTPGAPVRMPGAIPTSETPITKRPTPPAADTPAKVAEPAAELDLSQNSSARRMPGAPPPRLATSQIPVRPNAGRPAPP